MFKGDLLMTEILERPLAGRTHHYCFSNPTVKFCRGSPTCALGFSDTPVSFAFFVLSGRDKEHLRPHGSIDLVEEKPIPPLGRRNSSFGNFRAFPTSLNSSGGL